MRQLKNLRIWAGVILLAFLVGTIYQGHSQQQQEKTLKVELPAEGWNLVLEVINQSAAPHNQVVLVQQTLLQQLQPQISQDSTQTSGNKK